MSLMAPHIHVVTKIKHSQRVTLSLFGRILLTKTESLSRLIYPAFFLPLSPNLFKSVNTINHVEKQMALHFER